MTISNGQPVNAATDNSAFISKTATSGNTAVGIVDLNNGSSGDQVTNVQQAINDNRYETTINEEITASGEIASSTQNRFQYRRISGSGGAVTASNTPFGTGGGWTDGTIIRLIGTNDANSVTLTNNDATDGAILNGDIALVRYQSITLQYDSVLSRWIEQGRN